MNAPSFLKRKQEPSLPALPPEDTMSQRPKAVIDFLTATDQMREENAYLRAENDQLKRELGITNEHRRSLASELAEIKRDKDFLQRHDAMMLGGLDDLEVLIINLKERSRAQAFAPPGSGQVPEPELTEQDKQDLANIVATIRPEPPTNA